LLHQEFTDLAGFARNGQMNDLQELWLKSGMFLSKSKLLRIVGTFYAATTTTITTG